MTHFFVSPFFDGNWRLLIVLHHAENNITGLMNCREQRKSFFLFTFYSSGLVIGKLITNRTFTFSENVTGMDFIGSWVFLICLKEK